MEPTKASSSGVCQFRKIAAMLRLSPARQSVGMAMARDGPVIVKCSVKHGKKLRSTVAATTGKQ